MEYIVSFLEGIITFLSPCLLPMLPIYITYFAGGAVGDTKKTAAGALGFILGFTIVFGAMGAMAGSLGRLLNRWQTVVNLVCGGLVILFGLTYMGVLKLRLFTGGRNMQFGQLGFFSAVLFGMVFSISWTPCVGVFLGSALMLASQQGHVLEGMGMLLCYSLGLGIPFFISAILIDRLKGAFGWIKAHYSVVNVVCGGLLVLVGVLMATGSLGRLLAFLS